MRDQLIKVRGPRFSDETEQQDGNGGGQADCGKRGPNHGQGFNPAARIKQTKLVRN
jgi:hypothetical protein